MKPSNGLTSFSDGKPTKSCAPYVIAALSGCELANSFAEILANSFAKLANYFAVLKTGLRAEQKSLARHLDEVRRDEWQAVQFL